MMKVPVRVSVLGLLLASLAAVAATAQPVIQKGTDYWRTPANGQTVFEFPAGDVEALCGQAASDDWDHQVALVGVPAPGSDWDTAVARLDDAVFDTDGTARTRIQVKSIAFASIAPHETPCGRINWRVGSCCPQPITWMTLHRNANQAGGIFFANLAVNVEFKAYSADTGVYLGSLYYIRELPDQASGTPWSLGSLGEFRAGMTPTNNCVDVLRKKLSKTDPESIHYYRISELIAKGQCTDRPQT